MDQWCDIATEVEADDTIDPAFKMTTIAKRFSPMSPAVKNVFDATAQAPAEKKYELIEHAARQELGMADWSCPALERLNAPPTESELKAEE